MYIKELNLVSFGKFIDKKINFEKGFNIIHGDNEAGKSTVHNFIEMMLYGFEDSSKDKKIELYKKYRPWFNEDYNGELCIEKDEFDYSITKNFNTNEKNFVKHNIETDESVQTQSLGDYNELGDYLFGINKSIYTNTLSIKQLGNSTDEELAEELRNRIWNLGQTKDETISVVKLIKKLDAMKNEYGTVADTNSLLGQYKIRLTELNELREEIVSDKDIINKFANRKIVIFDEISEINKRLSQIDGEIENFKLLDLAKKKMKVDKILEEINIEKEKMEEVSGARDITVEEYEDAVKLITILEQMKNQKDEIEREFRKIESEINKLTNRKEYSLNSDGVVVNINLDYKKYKDTESKIDSLNQKVESGEKDLEQFDADEIQKYDDYLDKIKDVNETLERLDLLDSNNGKDEIDKLIKSAKKSKNIASLLSVVFLVAAGGSAYLGMMQGEMYYAGLVAAVPAIFAISKRGKSSKKISELENQLLGMNLDVEHREVLKKECEDMIQKLIDDSETGSLDGLISKCKNFRAIRQEYDNKLKMLNYDRSVIDSMQLNQDKLKDNLLDRLAEFDITELNDETIKNMNEMMIVKNEILNDIDNKKIILEGLEKQYKKSRKDYNYENGRFEIILKNNNISDVDEFKKQTNNSYMIIQIRSKIEGLERIAKDVLEDMTYEELTKKVNELDESLRSISLSDVKSKENEIKTLNDGKDDLYMELDNIDNQILATESNNKKLVEIEEEIEFYYKRVLTCKEKIEVIDITKKNILMIADYIKGDFIPVLKSAISENFTFVTGGKYSEVNIDQAMNIAVIDSRNNESIPLKSLSGGTLDQLYMSLRLGVSSLISDNKDIPLILDDSFIQYDESRLIKSLEILQRESQRRQVIILTCQKREQILADRLELDYNLIKLM